jgi:hypothetical protein
MIGFVKCGSFEGLNDHCDNNVPSYVKNKINLKADKFTDGLYIFFDTFEGRFSVN